MSEETAGFCGWTLPLWAEVIAAIDRVTAEAGKLDILVNAAGIEFEHTIEHTSLADWNRISAVNVTSTFLPSNYALPLLRMAASGGTFDSIINFGSYDGFIADPGLATYCASKGAVYALTRAMACDHGPDGIRVNAICPGYADTPMLRSFFAGAGSGAAGAELGDVLDKVKAVHPTRPTISPTLSTGSPQTKRTMLWVSFGFWTAACRRRSSR